MADKTFIDLCDVISLIPNLTNYLNQPKLSQTGIISNFCKGCMLEWIVMIVIRTFYANFLKLLYRLLNFNFEFLLE